MIPTRTSLLLEALQGDHFLRSLERQSVTGGPEDQQRHHVEMGRRHGKDAYIKSLNDRIDEDPENPAHHENLHNALHALHPEIGEQFVKAQAHNDKHDRLRDEFRSIHKKIHFAAIHHFPAARHKAVRREQDKIEAAQNAAHAAFTTARKAAEELNLPAHYFRKPQGYKSRTARYQHNHLDSVLIPSDSGVGWANTTGDNDFRFSSPLHARRAVGLTKFHFPHAQVSAAEDQVRIKGGNMHPAEPPSPAQ